MRYLLTCSVHHLLAGTTAWLVLSAAVAALAQSDGTLALDRSWRTEVVELTDGRVLRGLVEEEAVGRLKFLEMRQRPGRPVTLVGHSLSSSEIVETTRLPRDAREVLRERLEAVRNRAAIEASRAQNVSLEPVDRDGIRFWSYSGPWFRIEAALEPPEVRRIVVRLEQVFRAFEQVLPPEARAAVDAAISLIIFGDYRQYAAFLRREGVAIRNPAYFDPARKQVVVSSDLARLFDVARAIEDEHLSRLRKLYPEDRIIADALAERDRALELGGFSDAERKRLLFMTRVRWQQDESALVDRMRRIERQNRAAVQEERDDLEARLFHEAFHAYADTHLAGTHGRPMPRWLSEGLAQVFEAPVFDADLLRIDAPDPERLARLQEDLRSPDPLSLGALLAADQTRFLVAHDASGLTSERHYLYAWGVAYYLAFEHPRFSSRRLADYAAEAERAPLPAFERLVGMSLAEFEAKWTEGMGDLQ